MDKRTAKREANWRVAMMAATAMEGYDLTELYSEGDALKVEEQIGVVIAELERRGHK